jgi:tRNA pseudouridine13 synthase
LEQLQREYFLNHSPIEFAFVQNSKDFTVSEIPLYEFDGEGEHLILQVRKRNLTTWDMVRIISKEYGIDSRDIGYAGLKDKNAMTVQYISIPKKFEKNLENFEEENIKILSRTYHKNKIKIGHLKGNRFFVRLKKVTPTEANRIKSIVKQLRKTGIPNYFGYQRFGMEGTNYLVGKEIAEGKSKIRDRNKKRLFLNSYQSYLFNNWLSERIRVSRVISSFKDSELREALKIAGYDFEDVEYLQKQEQPFKIFRGDVQLHYPFGRAFRTEADEVEKDIERFGAKDISPSGLLPGNRVMTAENDALQIEKKYSVDISKQGGERRYAWIYPEDIEVKYRESDFWFELNFTLIKGSYATTFIEEIAGRPIK